MGLQQAFHALLQGACEEEKRVPLVFDAVNEPEPHHNARSLGWLPQKLPRRSHNPRHGNRFQLFDWEF
jgi:hypothetical protein